MTLQDVDIAYFERVSFGLRNFDMVFVFKNFAKQPLRISIIPTTNLDQIKSWLGELDVVWYEGPTNMNWNNIMKEVNKDKQLFITNGGWDGWFGDVSGDEEDDDEEDEDSDFKEDEDSEGEEAGSGEDASEGSDDDSDVSSLVSEGSDDSDEGSMDSDESEGLSWEELEKKAAKEDVEKSRKRNMDETPDKNASKKKKR